MTSNDACALFGIKKTPKRGLPAQLRTLLDRWKIKQRRIPGDPVYLLAVDVHRVAEALVRKKSLPTKTPLPEQEPFREALSTAVYSSTDSSRMFQELENGAGCIECVIKLGIHPEAARAIYRVWNELRRHVVLFRPELERIEKMGLDGTFPIEDAPGLMDVIESAARERECTACHRRPGTVCRACVVKKRIESRQLKLPDIVKEPEGSEESESDGS